MTALDAKDDRPLYETVYEALRQRIADGSLQADRPLSEVQLADMLSVSRTPVRDAVRRLVAEKLLIMPARGTVRVYSPTAEELADLYCTRAALESMAARLAAMRADEAFLRRLSAICDRRPCLPEPSGQGAPVIQRDIVHAAVELNGEFHQAILEQSGNARIIHLLENLKPVIVRYRQVSLMFPEHLKQSWDEHRSMIDHFADMKPENVEALVHTHILKAGGRIVATMMRMEVERTEPLTPSMELVLNA